MTKLKTWLGWMVWNAAIVLVVYLALHEHIEGAENLLGLVAFIYALSGIGLMVEDDVPDRTFVPEWVDLSVTIPVIAAPVWSGWFASAAAITFSAVASHEARTKVAKPEEGAE